MSQRIEHLAELAAMLKRASPHLISGREPDVDWHGARPRDQNVTLCVRMTRKDRSVIVRALRTMIKQNAAP